MPQKILVAIPAPEYLVKFATCFYNEKGYLETTRIHTFPGISNWKIVRKYINDSKFEGKIKVAMIRGSKPENQLAFLLHLKNIFWMTMFVELQHYTEFKLNIQEGIVRFFNKYELSEDWISYDSIRRKYLRWRKNELKGSKLML